MCCCVRSRRPSGQLADRDPHRHGQDGLRGCEAVREAGGQILAQDEATSVVWGMPGYVARAGLADRVLPLAMIGDEIVQRVGLNAQRLLMSAATGRERTRRRAHVCR